MKAKNFICFFKHFLRVLPILAFLLLPAIGVATARSADQTGDEAIGKDASLYLLFAEGSLVHAKQLFGEPHFLLESLSIDDAMKLSGLPRYDVYDIRYSPVDISQSNDEFGFSHGVWSSDKSSFAWLELGADAARYRVRLLENGLITDYVDDRVSATRGYLDPLVWTDEGKLLLSERYIIDQFQADFRVWELDPLSGSVSLYHQFNTPATMGRTLIMPEADQVLIGFSSVTREAYFYDQDARLTRSFLFDTGPINAKEDSSSAASDMSDPSGPSELPTSNRIFPIGFARGLLDSTGRLELSRIGDVIDSVTPANQRPAAFLYWPLPDSTRRIYGYPDSPWTAANKPGQTYSGHQGTDAGPVQQTTGAEVYASAPGVVTSVYNQCPNHTRNFSLVGSDLPDRNCNIINDSDGSGWGKHNWGNSVIIGHNVIVNGNARVWYSAYGHLMKDSIPSGLTVGSEACRGLKIGVLGHTGYSSGPHLHFEIRNGGSYTSWDDPWGSSDYPYGASLWAGGNARPAGAKENTTCGCCNCSLALAGASSIAFQKVFAVLGPYFDEPEAIIGPNGEDDTFALQATTVFEEASANKSQVLLFPKPDDAVTINAPTVYSPRVQEIFRPEVTFELPASANYQIVRSVKGMGGGPKTSSSYTLLGTSGQPFATGLRTSTNYRLSSGYWGASADFAISTPTPTVAAPVTNTPTSTATATASPSATATATAIGTAPPVDTPTSTPKPTATSTAESPTATATRPANLDFSLHLPVIMRD